MHRFSAETQANGSPASPEQKDWKPRVAEPPRVISLSFARLDDLRGATSPGTRLSGHVGWHDPPIPFDPSAIPPVSESFDPNR